MTSSAARRRERGYTLLEIVISMALFAIFVAIFFMLTAEVRNYEKRLPVNFMKHPQVMSVLARLRRDVQDVHVASMSMPIYVNEHDGYENGPKTLILNTWFETGLQTIVWDFTEPGVVKRIAYKVGDKSEWVARGLPPEFSAGVDFDALKIPGRPYAVRLIAKDGNGTIAIDQILQPRTHF